LSYHLGNFSLFLSLLDDIIMETLLLFHDNLLKNTSDGFFRALYHEVQWNQRMIAIKGPRGAGKTTLMLQQIKYGMKAAEGALYITADHPFFYTNSLFDFAGEWVKSGGKFLFIDEVHKYPRWSVELKNIYDGYPGLKVVFSASSALDIYRGEADLSRRVISYELPGMSFREYLSFTGQRKFDALSFDSILTTHREAANAITHDEFHPLPFFRDYLQWGYLPILAEGNKENYLMKLNQVINTIIDTDLSYTEEYTAGAALKVKKLLGVLAESVPFKPNIAAIARKLDISRDSVYMYLQHLQKARLLNFLVPPNKGVSLLQKPEKIFLENTNLAFALKEKPEKGSLRETFLLNQLLNSRQEVFYSSSGDFVVNDIIIEAGGRHKTGKPVSGSGNVYIAADDIETGFEHKIPLWLFGFLY
jgi:predicted AAA+ superfamily ATPase